MKRLEGIRIIVPSQVNLHARPDTPAPVHLPELGRLEDTKVIDRHTLSFTFVALTEAGEYLIDALRQGKAELKMEYNTREKMAFGRRPMAMTAWFTDEKVHETWLFRFGQSSLLAGIGYAPPTLT